MMPEGKMMDNMNKATEWLEKAIARHERHMAGTEPTNAASQQKLMEEMKKALSLLTEVHNLTKENKMIAPKSKMVPEKKMGAMKKTMPMKPVMPMKPGAKPMPGYGAKKKGK